MRFYNRINELNELKRIQSLLFNEYSRMPVVTGRRRIGKTSLIIKSVEDILVSKTSSIAEEKLSITKIKTG